MHLTIPFASFVLAGCLLGPTHSAGSAPLAPGDPFPASKQSITLPADSGAVTLERLVRELERVSGARFVSGPHSRQLLAQTPCGLSGPLEIAASEAWSTTEALLAHQGLVIVPLCAEGARIFGLESASGPAAQSLRGRAFQATAEGVEALSVHPALLVQTTIDTSPLDARGLANSMRSLLGDPMTEQIVALGNTNRLLLLGRAPQVAGWARTLRSAGQVEAR